MGRISKRHLNQAIEERIFALFWQHIASLSTPFVVAEFLQSLLSHTEQVMIAKRLAIAILLSRGYSYQYIDDTLKVSKSTIATVDRQMISGAPGFKHAAHAVDKRKAQEEMWDSLEEVLLKIALPARYGSVRHQLKSIAGKGLRKRKFQRENI